MSLLLFRAEIGHSEWLAFLVDNWTAYIIICTPGLCIAAAAASPNFGWLREEHMHRAAVI